MLTVTATELPRLMACNGSRLMTGIEKPDVEKDDTVKNEGNAADWLVDQVRSGKLPEELIDRKASNGVYIDHMMVEHLEEYFKFIKQGGYVEIDVSHGADMWRVNGRADHALYDENTQTLFISDLKYGWRIYEPEMNWTLISHACGFLEKYKKPVKNIVFTIFQPRPYHAKGQVRSWQIDYNQLVELWGQIATTLSNPDDRLNTSENCINCPGFIACPAARKAEMNVIDASENFFVDNIDNDGLSFQLDQLKRAQEMLKHLQKAYKELALHRLKKGDVIANYSVSSDLANTTWRSYVTPETIEGLTGKDLTKKQLITPNQAKQQGMCEITVKALTERKKKGFKLVRVEADVKAKQLFGDRK